MANTSASAFRVLSCAVLADAGGAVIAADAAASLLLDDGAPGRDYRTPARPPSACTAATGAALDSAAPVL